MGSSTGAAAVLLLCVALSMVAAGSAAAASSYKSNFISREALERSDMEPASSSSSSSRELVEMGEPSVCPVHFNQMHNFAAIASGCKGPRVSAAQCCGAFKEFACPYRDLMNDLENNCAREMMDQILSTCGLPHGTFSDLCHEGSEGLACY